MAEENLILKAKNHTFPGFKIEEESSWSGPFAFIQGADTQFGFIENYIEKKPNPGWDKEVELTRRAIASVNAMCPRPRFFVVCGDLVDAFPGTSLRYPQEQSFFHLFKELHPDIPLVCVCGNHDVGDDPTHESIQIYKKKFGDDYFTFFCGGVMFIVINSQFYKAPEKVQDLAEEQEKWLDRQLKEAKSGKFKHVVVFQHIPWFIRNPDEEDVYFNIKTEIREKMLKKFYDANVRAVFCGHWHGNAGGFYKDLEVVVTSAIGGQLRGDKSGFRVVKVSEDSIHHTYFALEDVPKDISLN
ncbi:serine/threonine-protein phosphatase CPPED1-like isoform X1 [Argiope bruennichi]|uniref:serine/threonine-protein phosphatase CPPED1-like isoform X1 n=1 Tax=Argiope bruennichi TaxID=94029 RepID=UPI00249566BF|nr:serine/threonine-protein phosphatase CPPED1-like isoform X1 [Argiope bruennichi]XP_055948753.1 serine/threonine-protein phosphatase CPPED1-like isoform X1 [Argiope bruennichi]XP_055948754.1 serine/threonine-protein phosphatase CPPED1-like isoform X1 [Argiope bruennichi]XP_055948755.1 serine/threonine-protein phosphatase CPPED1-like isoform X1 [Argiope bruennichi]XP_055948756.1 serine/threonine-protein phosphatase CPPED1-like isoform X1 [Argiope bruennichi]